MSVVERLEAAIEKLEVIEDREPLTIHVEVAQGSDAAEFFQRAHENLETHLRLVPVLLNWLRDQRSRLRVDVGSGSPEVHYRHALAVADAILGGAE